MVIDDWYATIGSDNVNRRSWTHDSELAALVIDDAGLDHSPFARSLRLRLAAEHLDRPGHVVDALEGEHGVVGLEARRASLDVHLAVGTGLEHLAGFLAQTYDERPVSAGLQSNGQLLQIFASAGSGSWTAVTTSPGGTACVVATGRDWEQAAGAASAAEGGGTEGAYRPAAARP